MESNSPPSSPELNPLALGGLSLDGRSRPRDSTPERVLSGGDGNGNSNSNSNGNGGADDDAFAPLPEYKAAGETVLDFDGLLPPPLPPLRLHEDLAKGCGGQAWPAGMVLARHLLRHRQAEMASSRILELGAGGGLVGLAVAIASRGSPPPSSPSPLYITDQLPMLPLMQHNIALNGLEGAAKALVLNWGDPLPLEVQAFRPTIILAADCCYFEPAFPLLMTTLEDLLLLGDAPAEPGSDGGTAEDRQDSAPLRSPVTIYFCFKKRRRADMHFLKKAQKRFCVTEVADDDRPVFSRQGLFLYAMTRKARPAPPAKLQKKRVGESI